MCEGECRDGEDAGVEDLSTELTCVRESVGMVTIVEDEDLNTELKCVRDGEDCGG